MAKRESTIALIDPESVRVGSLELPDPCPVCGGKRRQSFIPKAKVRATERIGRRFEKDATLYRSVIFTTCDGCDGTTVAKEASDDVHAD